MNFLRRELAPISPQGWSEIDSVAKKALAANLSGRKFVDVDGPHGHTAAEISLFITESFTFRVIAPEALVGFTAV
jgi:uncharacterized linocin/CFP29 family protein